MKVRPYAAADRGQVRDMLTECGAFSAEEIQVALEMADAAPSGDYTSLVVETGGIVRGYACIGRAVLTAGAWYLYWICVHPAVQRGGVGRSLQKHVEAHVRAAGGDRLVLETSGRPDYARTRRFYRNAGYTEVGRIPGFYKPEDDCVVYCKILDLASVRE